MEMITQKKIEYKTQYKNNHEILNLKKIGSYLERFVKFPFI